MSEQRRFNTLVKGLQAERAGVSKLPVFTTGDAGALTRGLYRESTAIEEAGAAAARAQGETIACERGCSACCRTAVVVTEPESIAAAQFLLEEGNAEARARFEQAYPIWRERLGDQFDDMMASHNAGDQEASRAKFWAIKAEAVMCPFNHDDACVIYPVRPHTCRRTVVLDTNEYCQPGSEEGPTLMRLQVYDQYMDVAGPLLITAHNRLRSSKPEPMADAVNRLLENPNALTVD